MGCLKGAAPIYIAKEMFEIAELDRVRALILSMERLVFLGGGIFASVDISNTLLNWIVLDMSM